MHAEYPATQIITPVSLGVKNNFYFFVDEILMADLSRFKRTWNVAGVKAMSLAKKRQIIGKIDFGIAELIRSAGIPIDSPAFIRFCCELRADSNFLALCRLDTPDYPLVFCVSTPNVSFVRREDGITVLPDIPTMRLESRNDQSALCNYCIATGIIDLRSALKQHSNLFCSAMKIFWPS